MSLSSNNTDVFQQTVGGGVTDHTLLTNLPWLSSGHTFSAALKIAGSNSGGSSVEIPYSVFGGTLLSAADAAAGRTALNAQTQSTILDNVTALATNGLVARTGAGTVATRTLVVGAGLTVSNADGVAGNPTLGLGSITVQTELDASTYRWWQMQPESTSVVGTGVTAPFVLGAGTSSAAGFAGTYQGITYTITNSGSSYLIRTNQATARTTHGGTNGVVIKGHFVSGSVITGLHCYTGFFTTPGTATTPANACCGIYFRDTLSANWQVFSYDGTTFATADTGVPYSANTHYWLKMRFTSSGGATTGVYGVVATSAAGLSGPETFLGTGLVSGSSSFYQGTYWIRDATGAATFTFCGLDYAASIV